MCFLNGDLGGNLTASIDFGTEEYYDKVSNTTTYTKVPIQKIIREAVHAYAGEPYHNIVLNDLDETAVELLEYRGDTPLYLLRDDKLDQFTNYTDDGDTLVYFADDSFKRTFALSVLESSKGGHYDPRVELEPTAVEIASKLKFAGDPNNIYTVAKVEYGQTAGYRYTDLTYAGDLISSIGESITSILDKIKTMLGEYEYFYDLDGRFVFQRKKNYIQNSWNSIVKAGGEEYVENAAYTSSVVYKFEDGTLVTSFQNSPNLSNLKNDYSIWGERESVSGAKLPIHYRYAIDVKPEIYTTLNITADDIKGYNSSNPDGIQLVTQKSVTYSAEDYDWRELIYQMALDYFKYNQLDCYTTRLIEANPDTCFTGVTGYEQYYTDLQGFWRQLYDIDPQPKYSNYQQNLKGSVFVNQDEKENTIPLFIKGKYKKIDSPVGYDSSKILALTYMNYYNGAETISRYELQPWLEAIQIKDFETNPGNYYRVGKSKENSDAATYIPLTAETKGYVQKSELFVKEGSDFVSLLKSSKNMNGILGLYIFNDDKEYYNVLELDPQLQPLYFNDKYYNRYLYQSRLDITGTPTQNMPAVEYNIDYYGEFYSYNIDGDINNKYWTKDIQEAPASLNFWFDFLDANSELGEFSVRAVGDRTKAVNDNKVTSIYYREVSDLIFTTYKEYKNSDLKDKTGYTPVFVTGNLENMFSISSQGQSAQDKLDSLLYNNSYCIENVTLQAIPVYYLEPNTRIFIRDDLSKINGEYIVSKISLPLAYNGTMSITATKAPTRLI